MSSADFKDSAAKRLGVTSENGEISLDGKSLLAGMGGWLGVLEAIIPSMLFGISFAIFSEPIWAVGIAGSTSAIFIIFRLVTRKSPASAIVGALAVAFAAWLALREGGQAVDYFIPGFITNASYASVLLISILLRWPLIGVAVEVLRGRDFSWRKQRRTLAIYSMVTALWVGFFTLRLAVQLPLYFAGNTELLATARVIMGPPLYAMLIVGSWLILRATVLKSR